MPQSLNSILNLPDYEVLSVEGHDPVVIRARHLGSVHCPECGGVSLRKKDRFVRRLHHESIGVRRCILQLEAGKYHCLACDRYFHQRFPGVLPYRRSTEGYRREIFVQHRDGICQTQLARRGGIGTATVERWFQDLLGRKLAERQSAVCPRVLGIDEHFFSRKEGYATTLCDLEHHRVYDVVLGRSEAALAGYFQHLREPERVRVVCMDLSSPYRALVRRFFPNARIVADRFHVVRLINQAFLHAWKQLDPVGGQNRGLLGLMRRHAWTLKPLQELRLQDYLAARPALAAVYAFKQRLVRLMLIKHRTKRQCRRLASLLLNYVEQLRASPLVPFQTLGATLHNWREEVACMWRFTKNNGITEGFHTKMEMISRRAYGFRNFQNYRLRVRVLCA
jgi:transposase